MISYKILTLFPDLIEQYWQFSPHYKRGIDAGIFSIESIQLRQYAQDKHQKVDDTVYAGGPGLLLKPDVMVRAIEAHSDDDTSVIMVDPKGEVFSQEVALSLAKKEKMLFVAGRYEGFDARIQNIVHAKTISLGDYILTNGELPILVILDAIIRLHEGTCDDQRSIDEESFSNGLLEYDQFTRPFDFRGHTVPDILLSGHHENIKYWKLKNSIKNSIKSRPELLKRLDLMSIDLNMIRQLVKELWQ